MNYYVKSCARQISPFLNANLLSFENVFLLQSFLSSKQCRKIRNFHRYYWSNESQFTTVLFISYSARNTLSQIAFKLHCV